MFNLLIRCGPDSWNSSPIEYVRERVAIEYTEDEISERYKSLEKDKLDELKGFPTLFATEGETVPSRIGYIDKVELRGNSVVVYFSFDEKLPELPIGTLKSLMLDFDLSRTELYRTHWAIKDEDLFSILIAKGYITDQQFLVSKIQEVSQKSQKTRFPRRHLTLTIRKFLLYMDTMKY